MLLNVGDLVKMRKAHPCGNDLWIITYVAPTLRCAARNAPESSCWIALPLKSA